MAGAGCRAGHDGFSFSEVLRSSTRRLRRLTEDIGAVSHAEEGNLRLDLRPAEAAAVASTAADAARDRYESKGVRLDVDLHPAGRVNVDPDRIGQVLGNLIDNALRHTPEGGSVTVSCRRVEHWVEYAVADTGEGIAAEHLRRRPAFAWWVWRRRRRSPSWLRMAKRPELVLRDVRPGAGSC